MTPLSDSPLWSLACEAYRDDLPVILRSNVSANERRPGLNNPIRVHKSVIGVDGFTALREALVTQRSNGFHQIQGCLEIREPLAWHLVRHLRQKLIIVGHASASIRDQRFAADLGLRVCPGDATSRGLGHGGAGRHQLWQSLCPISIAAV